MAAPHMNAGLPFRSTVSIPPSRFAASASSFGYIVAPDSDMDDQQSSRHSPRSPAIATPTNLPFPTWSPWNAAVQDQSNLLNSRFMNSDEATRPASARYRPHHLPPQVPLGPPTSSSQKPVDSVAQPTAVSVERKPIEGDCSICWDSLQGQEKDLVYCQKTCGQNFHKSCFVDWLKTPKHQHAEPELKCPYCRGTWDASELRRLQLENGVSPPPRPHKRPRPDYTIRAAQRDFHRRLHRERQQSQRRDGVHFPRIGLGGFQSRPMVQSPYAASFDISPPSLTSRQPAQSMPLSASSQPSRSNSQAVQASASSPRLIQSPPLMYGGLAPPFSMQPQMISMNPAIPSHDLTAPGYSMAPSFAPNAFSTPALQQQRQSLQSTDFWGSPISHCPHMRAQMQVMQPGLAMSGAQGVYPGLPRICPQPPFEVQINQFVQHQTMHTYNYYS